MLQMLCDSVFKTTQCSDPTMPPKLTPGMSPLSMRPPGNQLADKLICRGAHTNQFPQPPGNSLICYINSDKCAHTLQQSQTPGCISCWHTCCTTAWPTKFMGPLYCVRRIHMNTSSSSSRTARMVVETTGNSSSSSSSRMGQRQP